MPLVPYTKPALSYAGQLQQLKNRGLHIENDDKAIHLLQNLSYYRLSGYWYPLLTLPKEAHKFKPNASFNNGFNLYCFDRELRQLVIGEIEKIEVAIRSQMIYEFSHAFGPFWFNNQSLFVGNDKHTTTLQIFSKDFKYSQEDFINQFKNKYSDPYPPCWMMLEITSFGSLSNIFKNIHSKNPIKRKIANYFGLTETVFISWIHSLVYVRNLCAHHSRLWNKKLSIAPVTPKSTKHHWIKIQSLPDPITGRDIPINGRTYYLLCMIIYLLHTVNPKHTFKHRLYKLFRKYHMIDISALGFPKGWKNEALWQWAEIQKWYHFQRP